MVKITKISSKGQVVIPQEIRKKLDLEEGNLMIVSDQNNTILLDQNNTILLKKIEIPKIKTWEEVTKPFREAAKKVNFSEEDLERVIAESRLKKK
ncbi:AbrB/MazE/SpoVT family DNA-binding domain-containing protein [Candidatus Woesearchaeota archaeon]|nr:AbrB/MazE/SpoVT family DNA-binding domain-containing protein [Candidatus Woesearchaeota archaeon]